MRLYSNQHIESHQKLFKLSLFAFLANFPNFLISIVSAFTAGTMVVWVDTFVSLNETLHAFAVMVVAKRMCRENGDKYNFGMARLEVFISFLCDVLVSAAMLGVFCSAALSLRSPSLPASSLLWFCLLKVSNSSFDVYFLVKQIKICKLHPSKLNETEKIAYRVALINDVTVGIVVTICYIFRTKPFVLYFSPIVSMLLAIMFLVRFVIHMKSCVSELTDVSLPVKKQDEIYDIVMSKPRLLSRIETVNCRRINGNPHIELSLTMQEGVTYGEMRRYLQEIREEIKKVEEDATVVLVIGDGAEG